MGENWHLHTLFSVASGPYMIDPTLNDDVPTTTPKRHLKFLRGQTVPNPEHFPMVDLSIETEVVASTQSRRTSTTNVSCRRGCSRTHEEVASPDRASWSLVAPSGVNFLVSHWYFDSFDLFGVVLGCCIRSASGIWLFWRDITQYCQIIGKNTIIDIFLRKEVLILIVSRAIPGN